MFIEVELKEDVAEIYLQDLCNTLFYWQVKGEFVKKSYLLLDEIPVFTELYMPRYLATWFTSIK